MEEHLFGTVLVVGGSGFLGSYIVQRLLSGNQVSHIAVTSRNPTSLDDSRVTCYTVDIGNREAVQTLFATLKPQVVIHVAAPTPRAPAKAHISASVTGTQNLLHAAKECLETKAFVFAGSNSAYRPVDFYDPFTPITEDECELWDNKTYNNSYGKTKALAEKAVLAANSSELKTAVMRLPLVYGAKGDPHFFHSLMDGVRKGQHKTQVGPNKRIWEYVYVESAAEAHILAAKALVSGTPGADGQAYFITDDNPMLFFDFHRKCCAAGGYPVAKDEIKVVPFWVVKTFVSITDWMYWIFTLGTKRPAVTREDISILEVGFCWNIEKARRLLGYRPVLEQDEAVRICMEWWTKNA
jgi:sterol-4alpha-carboxylate 3-dehydrogenase (decarboxylating)